MSKNKYLLNDDGIEENLYSYEWFDNFERVFSFEHLLISQRKCSSGVRWKKSYQLMESNRSLEIAKIYDAIMDGTYKTKGFYKFTIYERGKKRNISSIAVNERVVQRCLCDYCLVPAIDSHLIYDNGSTRIEKGVHFTKNRLEHHLRSAYGKYGSNNFYIALFDFSKYFDTISHDLIEHKILRKYLRDERLIQFTMSLVNDFGDIGLGLGSQISQILAVAAPNELDHAIKDDMRIKYYGRYMDDFYIIGKTKEELSEYAEFVYEKSEELGFTINKNKTIITPVQNFKFLKIKWSVLPNGKILKIMNKKSFKVERKKLRKLHIKQINEEITLHDCIQSFESWESNVDYCRSHYDKMKVVHSVWETYGKDNWENERKNPSKGYYEIQYT